jgi:hypothetical protein
MEIPSVGSKIKQEKNNSTGVNCILQIILYRRERQESTLKIVWKQNAWENFNY